MLAVNVSAVALAKEVSVNSKESVKNQKVEEPEIPPDMPQYFLKRYEQFIPGKVAKPIEKINKRLKDLEKSKKRSEAEVNSLLAERQQLIDKFWSERDFKQIVDERIEDIQQEIFFQSQETPGLLFGANGGFRGDMAQVYLLHGSPGDPDLGFISIRNSDSTFNDLMLWLYMDKEGENIRFAFLFYRKGLGGGSFELLSQDSFMMDPCGAVNEIMRSHTYAYRGCTDEIYNALRQLELGTAVDGTPGYYYAWALFNFSQDPGLRQGKALQPPSPVSELLKRSTARVIGEPAPLTAEEKVSRFVFSDCDSCNSMIPAELNKDELTVSIVRKNLDWAIVGDEIKTELKIRIIIESLDDKKSGPIVVEIKFTHVVAKKLLTDNPEGKLVLYLLPSLASLPAGNYTVNIYIKNVLTNNAGENVSNKYAAWLENFVKK